MSAMKIIAVFCGLVAFGVLLKVGADGWNVRQAERLERQSEIHDLTQRYERLRGYALNTLDRVKNASDPDSPETLQEIRNGIKVGIELTAVTMELEAAGVLEPSAVHAARTLRDGFYLMEKAALSSAR